jgi:hypothetical protein
MNILKLCKNIKPQQHTPNPKPANKNEVLLGLKLCCDYFERNIQNDPTFEPEFKSSKIINSLLENNYPLTETHLQEIISIINNIDKIEHYNGSGWLDYKLRLNHFFYLSGLDLNFIG